MCINNIYKKLVHDFQGKEFALSLFCSFLFVYNSYSVCISGPKTISNERKRGPRAQPLIILFALSLD